MEQFTVEALRESFEQWATKTHLDIRRDKDGFYRDVETFIAWAAWQASIAHSAQAQPPTASVPVDAVMRVIDGQRRLPYRSIDEKQAFRNSLDAALAAQENPNG